MAYESMKKQNFGIEIELTGITRRAAADVIARYFGTTSTHVGGGYDPYTATDRKGRVWRAMTDGSIHTKKRVNGVLISANRDYSCEVVSPVLRYEDMEDLQEIIRQLRKAGAIANSSCGIHVHVDGKDHTPESLTRLMGFAIGRQDLFYEALGIGDRANRWCKKMNRNLLQAMKKDAVRTKDSLERIWYSAVNDGYEGSIDHQHFYNVLLVNGGTLSTESGRRDAFLPPLWGNVHKRQAVYQRPEPPRSCVCVRQVRDG
ncbi:hypothetical protein D5272_18800 [bacterium D16-76]|nr:hypothetical protein [bacterium D16-76]